MRARGARASCRIGSTAARRCWPSCSASRRGCRATASRDIAPRCPRSPCSRSRPCAECSRLHVLDEFLEIERLALGRELLAPVPRSISVLAEQHALRGRDAAHPQIDVQARAGARAGLRSARAARARRCPDRSGRSTACWATDRSRRAPRAAPWRGLPSTTTEMLRSEAPCAIARTLIAARPSELNTLRGDAVRARHAVADDGQDAQPAHVDALNLTRRAVPCRTRGARSSARTACASGIAKQIECSELPWEIRITEMPASRSAPNSRCAVPGTPIMPAPSRLTSATGSIVVMPLTGSAEVGCAQISVPRFCGREGVADVDRDVARDRRLHRLRMDDLGAEVRQLHRLVVGELVDDLGIRHQARIGRQHAVDVGPDVDLGALSSAPKIDPENRCRCGRAWSACPDRGRDEAGDDQPSGEIVGHELAQIRLALRPLHGGAERSPLDDDDLARIDPRTSPGCGALAQNGANRRVDQISP
jgi:hypothetical protein